MVAQQVCPREGVLNKSICDHILLCRGSTQVQYLNGHRGSIHIIILFLSVVCGIRYHTYLLPSTMYGIFLAHSHNILVLTF